MIKLLMWEHVYVHVQVDITYAPFIERFQPYLLDVKNYDIKVRPHTFIGW